MLLRRRTFQVVCLLVLGLLLASVFLASPPVQGVRTQGWELAQFIEHLHARGVRVRVIPTRADGRLDQSAYLTEDPDETWASCAQKVQLVEYVDRWRGTALVQRHTAESCLVLPLDEGENRCWIGDFVLFGDKELLRRIQRAFRPGLAGRGT